MSKKTVRLEPYYLEDPEDERIPMSVASYAALLKPGFVLDMTQATESQERSTDYDTIWDARVGKDQGLNIVHSRKIDPESGNPTSMGLEASTFGLPEGSSASIKFETRWNKGNRSLPARSTSRGKQGDTASSERRSALESVRNIRSIICKAIGGSR